MISKKLSFFVILTIVLFVFSMSTVSAVDIQANATNSQIQTAIDSANNGDTINFLGDKYDNISLSINNKAINFQGKNKTTLSLGEGGINLITLKNATGTSFSGFNFSSIFDSRNTYLIYSNGNAKDLTLTNNDFTGSNIQISLYNALNCSIDSNNFYGSSDISIDFGRNMYDPFGIYGNNTISNNKFIQIGYDVIQTSMENTTIFGNLISNYGLKLPDSDMVSMFNGSIGIFFTKEYSYGSVYNNTFQNGDIAIKHGKLPPVGLLLEIYNNKFLNLITGIEYNTKGDIKNYNNIFNSVSTAIILNPGDNVLKLNGNTYVNVGTPIFMKGDFGVDPSKKPANITITTNITAKSVNINDQVTYTIKIHNNGDLAAKNLILSNLIINGTNSVSTIVSSGNYTNGLWTIDNLAGGSDAMVVFVVKGKTVGSYIVSTNANYQSGENTNILSTVGPKIALTVKKASPTPPTPTPATPAKIRYSVKDKVQGKKLVRTITIKNIGGKAGTISGTLKIASNLKYSKTVVGKYSSYKYIASKKSLFLKVTNLSKSTSTTITIYFNKK